MDIIAVCTPKAAFSILLTRQSVQTIKAVSITMDLVEKQHRSRAHLPFQLPVPLPSCCLDLSY